MKSSIPLTLLTLSQLICFAQVDTAKRRFADTEPIIRRYRALCQKAYEANNTKLAYTYYDSIADCITHSYIDNYKFQTINDKTFEVDKSSKPIFLTVSASWCEPCRAEIPALNKIANEYSDKVNFLVLFWDLKKDMVKLAKLYNPKMYLVPSKTKTTDEEHIIDISGFRNINGYPDVFLINEKKRIIGFKTGASVPGTFTDNNGKKIIFTEQDAFNQNYKRLKEEVELLLSKN